MCTMKECITGTGACLSPRAGAHLTGIRQEGKYNHPNEDLTCSHCAQTLQHFNAKYLGTQVGGEDSVRGDVLVFESIKVTVI